MKLEVGQKVWARSVLERGFMIEEKVCDKTRDFREELYFISNKGLRVPYRLADLVWNEGEARLICQAFLEANKRQAEKKLQDFLTKNISSSSFKMAWEVD